MSQEIRERVGRVLITIFPGMNPAYEDAWGPCDIDGWDSIAHLDLVMALCEEFSIELDFDDVMSIETLGDIHSMLCRKGIS